MKFIMKFIMKWLYRYIIIRHFAQNVNIKGLVTIAGKLSDEIDKGTLNSIYKQANIKIEVLI